MKLTFDHQLEQSFLFWLDNTLIEEGRGFGNFSGALYSGQSPFSDYRVYASPYRQWVYDSSMSGAVVPSGIYSGATCTTSGHVLDFNDGAVLVSGNTTGNFTASFSYKEINIYSTQFSEQVVLYDKKYSANPRSRSQRNNITDKVYPCMFVRYEEGENERLSFEGMFATRSKARVTFISDSPYLYRSAVSILRDKKEKFFPILAESQLPFTSYGALNSSFDYSEICANATGNLSFIKNIRISNFSEAVNAILGDRVYGGILEFEFENHRFAHNA